MYNFTVGLSVAKFIFRQYIVAIALYVKQQLNWNDELIYLQRIMPAPNTYMSKLIRKFVQSVPLLKLSMIL